MTSLRPSIVTLTAKPSAAVPGVWLSLDHRQEPRVHASADELLQWVRRRDARRSGFAVTVIEWTDVPEGFQPPSFDA